jgi:hypothetical protein
MYLHPMFHVYYDHVIKWWLLLSVVSLTELTQSPPESMIQESEFNNLVLFLWYGITLSKPF